MTTPPEGEPPAPTRPLVLAAAAVVWLVGMSVGSGSCQRALGSNASGVSAGDLTLSAVLVATSTAVLAFVIARRLTDAAHAALAAGIAVAALGLLLALPWHHGYASDRERHRRVELELSLDALCNGHRHHLSGTVAPGTVYFAPIVGGDGDPTLEGPDDAMTRALAASDDDTLVPERVVCITVTDEVVERSVVHTAAGDTLELQRRRASVWIRAVRSRDGVILGQRTVLGPMPPPFVPAAERDVDGGLVPADELRAIAAAWAGSRGAG